MNKIIDKKIIIDEKPYTVIAFKTLNGVDIVFSENGINIFKMPILEIEQNIYEFRNQKKYSVIEDLIDFAKYDFESFLKNKIT